MSRTPYRFPFRRLRTAVVTWALAIFFAAPALPSRAGRQSPLTPALYASQLFDLTNAARVANGLAPLNADPRLASAALVHSQDMADHDFLDHTGSDGSTPDQRIVKQGYDWSWWGENIAENFPTPQECFDALMASLHHRANILGTHFLDLGVGVVFVPQDFGIPMIFITQDFGRLRKPQPPPRPPKIRVAPARIAFPAIRVGTPAARSLTVTNTGGRPLIGTVGPLTGPFEVPAGEGAFTLQAGASQLVSLRFTPKKKGKAAPATLRIISNGGNVNVRITGSGK